MSAPPDPPDPVERLRRDGTREAFEVRSGTVAALGATAALLGAGSLLLVGLDVPSARGAPPAVMALLSLGLLAMGLAYLVGSRLVRRMVVGDGALLLLPVGVRVPIADLTCVKGPAGFGRPVPRLRAVTRAPRLLWLPGRVLWIGHRLDLWLVGADAEAVGAALNQGIEASA